MLWISVYIQYTKRILLSSHSYTHMKKELTKIQIEERNRAAREMSDRGLSLQAIADILHIPKSTVQKIVGKINRKGGDL